jgi:RNA polymerase sigma-70 factor (ECF subfamily)
MLSSSPATEVDLVQRIARGESDLLGPLYARYRSTLLCIALRVLRHREEAEDVVHDVFLLVAERAGQYVAERGSVGVWMATLTRNLCIDRLRRCQRRGLLRAEFFAHEPGPVAKDVETDVDDAGARREIHRALYSLHAVERRTLEGAFFDGLTYSEIAARDGLPVGTVKSRAHRGMASLRATLDLRRGARDRGGLGRNIHGQARGWQGASAREGSVVPAR